MTLTIEAAQLRLGIRAWGATDKGPVRKTNEDAFRIDRERGLCVLADGMGGHNAGEVASRLAVDTIVDAVVLGDVRGPFAPDSSISHGGTLLRNAVHAANGRVLEAARALPDYAGMGTTIVATLARGRTLSVAHVGDSRLYLHDGEHLRQLTADDSWMASMLACDPAVDPLTLQRHPLRNALTNVVGSRAEVHVHLLEVPLGGGEVLLLTTDGVHGVLDPVRLETDIAAARRSRSFDRLAGDVVAAAIERGSRDNCTAIVACCEAD